VDLRLHSAALAELRESADFYKIRSPQAAQRFATAIDEAIKAIDVDPSLCVRVGTRERACRVKKFPFQIIFRVSGEILYIVAVAHAKRRPGYWKRRK
jgi:toxin ParE1/3/4